MTQSPTYCTAKAAATCACTGKDGDCIADTSWCQAGRLLDCLLNPPQPAQVYIRCGQKWQPAQMLNSWTSSPAGAFLMSGKAGTVTCSTACTSQAGQGRSPACLPAPLRQGRHDHLLLCLHPAVLLCLLQQPACSLQLPLQLAALLGMRCQLLPLPGVLVQGSRLLLLQGGRLLLQHPRTLSCLQGGTHR